MADLAVRPDPDAFCRACGLSFGNPVCPHVPAHDAKPRSWVEQLAAIVERRTGKRIQLRLPSHTWFCEFCQMAVPLEIPHRCVRVFGKDKDA